MPQKQGNCNCNALDTKYHERCSTIRRVCSFEIVFDNDIEVWHMPWVLNGESKSFSFWNKLCFSSFHYQNHTKMGHVKAMSFQLYPAEKMIVRHCPHHTCFYYKNLFGWFALDVPDQRDFKIKQSYWSRHKEFTLRARSNAWLLLPLKHPTQTT